MASKKKIKKALKLQRRAFEQLQATNARTITERNEVWDSYDELHKWLRKHAPATLKRYPGDTPGYRPITPDEIMKFYYAPALRAQFEQTTPLFDQLNRCGG